MSQQSSGRLHDLVQAVIRLSLPLFDTCRKLVRIVGGHLGLCAINDDKNAL